jgi:hypothetical protein
LVRISPTLHFLLMHQIFFSIYFLISNTGSTKYESVIQKYVHLLRLKSYRMCQNEGTKVLHQVGAANFCALKCRQQVQPNYSCLSIIHRIVFQNL